MKRFQVAALLAGAALGVAGVAVAIVLSREEGRQAAKRMLDKTAPVADQARQIGERVAQSAAAQYQTLAPKAMDALASAREQAPTVVGAVSNRLPWTHRGEQAAELS
jgi:hypothetical protein